MPRFKTLRSMLAAMGGHPTPNPETTLPSWTIPADLYTPGIRYEWPCGCRSIRSENRDYVVVVPPGCTTHAGV